MTAQLAILDENLASLVAPPAFEGIPGARSAVVVLHVVNEGADTALDLALRVMERALGETVWNASGRPLVDGRRVDVRVVSGVGGLEVASGPWEPIGSGRELALPELATGQGVRLEVSLVLPIDAQGDQVELYLAVRSATITALGFGLSESVGDGVELGLGDGRVSQLVHGGDVAASDPAADTVEVGAAGWIAAGVPFHRPAETVTLDALDGDGVTLTAGSAYWAALALGVDGSLAVVKSPQAPAPLDPADRPMPPVGSVTIAAIHRDDSGVITAGDLEAFATTSAAAFSADGLAASIGPSRGLVDNRWWRHDGPEALTLDPNATIDVWRMPAGDLAITTDGSRPDPRALHLHQVETDAAAVLEHRDRRRFLGRPEVLRFVFGGPLVTGAVALADWPRARPGLIAPLPGQVVATTLDAAGTADATEWQIEVAEPGAPAVWEPLYTVGPGPSTPWDSTTRQDASSIPDRLVVPPRALVRCRVVGQTAGVQPSGAVVSVVVYRS